MSAVRTNVRTNNACPLQQPSRDPCCPRASSSALGIDCQAHRRRWGPRLSPNLPCCDAVTRTFNWELLVSAYVHQRLSNDGPNHSRREIAAKGVGAMSQERWQHCVTVQRPASYYSTVSSTTRRGRPSPLARMRCWSPSVQAIRSDQ